MITYTRGDITLEPSFANPVNVVGVMGRGLAHTVAQRWPGCVTSYKKACRERTLRPGTVLAWRKADGWIFQTPTKRHWSQPSTYELVEASMKALVAEAERLGVARVGIPRLGCGLGGLKWPHVRQMITAAANQSPVEFRLYGDAAIQEADRRTRPRCTAALA